MKRPRGEFKKLDEIRRLFGPAGVIGLELEYGRRGAITDDTQMTLFTGEAMIRWAHGVERGTPKPLAAVGRGSYLRWLSTQGEGACPPGAPGWLVGVQGLHARRAPGTTCLSALRGDQVGTPGDPINDRKGCGGVMRIAPVGLARIDDPFAAGCELAALTHGHATGSSWPRRATRRRRIAVDVVAPRPLPGSEVSPEIVGDGRDDVAERHLGRP